MRCFESNRLFVRLQVNLATGEGLEACLEALTAGGKRLVAVINCAALSQVWAASAFGSGWIGCIGVQLPVGRRRSFVAQISRRCGLRLDSAVPSKPAPAPPHPPSVRSRRCAKPTPRRRQHSTCQPSCWTRWSGTKRPRAATLCSSTFRPTRWVDGRVVKLLMDPCVLPLLGSLERRTGCDPGTAWPASCADGHMCHVVVVAGQPTSGLAPHNAGYNGRVRWSHMYPTASHH